MLRTLAREREARDALAAELCGSEAADEMDLLLAAPIGEREARHAVERLALGFVPATLRKHAPDAVADAFIARRLKERSLTFGASDARIDQDALINRLRLRA